MNFLFTPLFFETLDSTHQEAKRRVNQGERTPLLIRAGQQEMGRGRMGRRWVSPPGNLYMTLCFPCGEPINILSQIALVLGVSTQEVLARIVSPQDVQLKWPNDILIDGQKVCGLLVETDWYPPDERHCIVSIGVNVVSSPDMVAYPATHLQRFTNEEIDLEQLQQQLTTSFLKYYHLWQQEGFAPFQKQWLDHAYKLNERVSVSLPQGGRLYGVFSTIDATGAIIVRDDDGVEHTVVTSTVDFP